MHDLLSSDKNEMCLIVQRGTAEASHMVSYYEKLTFLLSLRLKDLKREKNYYCLLTLITLKNILFFKTNIPNYKF